MRCKTVRRSGVCQPPNGRISRGRPFREFPRKIKRGRIQPVVRNLAVGDAKKHSLVGRHEAGVHKEGAGAAHTQRTGQKIAHACIGAQSKPGVACRETGIFRAEEIIGGEGEAKTSPYGMTTSCGDDGDADANQAKLGCVKVVRHSAEFSGNIAPGGKQMLEIAA